MGGRLAISLTATKTLLDICLSILLKVGIGHSYGSIAGDHIVSEQPASYHRKGGIKADGLHIAKWG